jgi:hypothetical protein
MIPQLWRSLYGSEITRSYVCRCVSVDMYMSLSYLPIMKPHVQLETVPSYHPLISVWQLVVISYS